MPPTLAAIWERVEKAAAVKKAVSSESVHTDGASTVSTVLWESQANWMIRQGLGVMGRWMLPVGQQLQ